MNANIYVAQERGTTSVPIGEVYRDGRFDIFPEVQAKEYFDVRFHKDRLTITAGKYVGLIPLNSRTVIQVEPKMPVANLLSILAIAGGSMTELPLLQRDYSVVARGTPEVLPALGRAFVRAMQGIETQGLRKVYRQERIAESTVKGQIAFGESVQRFWSGGKGYSAVSEYHDLTADLSENRLLRFACESLLRQNRTTNVLKGTAPAVGHFTDLLERAGVGLEPPPPESLVSRDSDPVYRRAIEIARMIVYNRGIEFSRGADEIALPSFLVDLETLFESYVRGVLKRRLGAVLVLDGNKEGQKPLFDDVNSPVASPDVVLQSSDGHCLAIAEVKYKTAETRDDLNQVLGYGASFKTRRIVLVLPAATEADAGMSPVGSIGTMRVWRYRFNLAAAHLDAEEARCVAAFSELLELAG